MGNILTCVSKCLTFTDNSSGAGLDHTQLRVSPSKIFPPDRPLGGVCSGQGILMDDLEPSSHMFPHLVPDLVIEEDMEHEDGDALE